MRFPATSLVFLAAFGVVGCSGPAVERDRQAANPTAEAAAPAAAAPAPDARPDAPRIIVLGDSLTAGLGLDVANSFPSVLQRRLDARGLPYQVVNAGVSGDTSAGGLRRLEWAMSDGDPQVLIVALGGNDGLRGLPPEQLQQNLASIIARAQARGLDVVLTGMEAPPNFGDDYTSRFRAVYPALAKRYDVTLVPFLLDGVAGDPAFNQADGIHPNERGAERVADRVWRALEPVLASRQTSSR